MLLLAVRIRGEEKREGEVGGGDDSHRIVVCYVTFVGLLLELETKQRELVLCGEW